MENLKQSILGIDSMYSAPKICRRESNQRNNYTVLFPCKTYNQKNWYFKVNVFASLGKRWKITRHEVKLFKWNCINLQLLRFKTRQDSKHTCFLKRGGATQYHFIDIYAPTNGIEEPWFCPFRNESMWEYLKSILFQIIIMLVYEGNSKESSTLCYVTSSNTVQIIYFVTLHKRLWKASHRFQKCRKPVEALLKKWITISNSRCKSNIKTIRILYCSIT